jgi:hypothetical protein
MRPWWFGAVVTGMLALSAVAAAGTPIPGFSGTPGDELAGDLRGLLLKNMPDPLYEAAPNWGHQRERQGLHLRGPRGGEIHADVGHGLKNDGVWRRIKVTAPNPADNLVFDLRDVQTVEPGKISFVVFVAADLDFFFEQQRWLAGVKLYGESARARARVKVTLHCEATSRIEPKGLLPDVVFTLKVAKADLRYDNLVFEHIAGIGGEAARIIGDAAHAFLNEWRPRLEGDLLAKANAAIVKAGEHKEVRISLGKLLKLPTPPPTKPAPPTAAPAPVPSPAPMPVGRPSP